MRTICKRMPVRSPQKLSQQDTSNFASKVWSVVPKEVIQQSFKRCGSILHLTGSGNRELRKRLVGIATLPATVEVAFEDGWMDFIFCLDSKESFIGFSDCDD